MPKLSLDDPAARSLGYKHDAANVDLEEFPQRGRPEAANHYCKNCTLFQSSDGNEWGPCTVFPGKLVHANGWCSAYVARPA
ncbi:MAG: high-potential iron-sulfur protein [Xanthomonadaceae bacterium]|nr:high-potential iron-sulfur protein [Xanthomonadaceae bacterium]